MKRRRNEPHLQRISDPPNGNNSDQNLQIPGAFALGAAYESSTTETLLFKRKRRPRRRLRFQINRGFLFFVCCWSGFLCNEFRCCFAQQSRSNNNNNPEKGNTDCASLADRYDQAKKGNTNALLEYCNEPESDEPPQPLPEHGIAITFYSSLPAFGSDFNVLFTFVLMTYLNSTIYPESYYTLQYNTTFTEEGFADTSQQRSSRTKNEPPIAYDVYLQITDTKRIKTFEAYWWWKYEMKFFCFTPGIGPLLNRDILDIIEGDLNRNLRNLSTLVASFQLWELSRGVLGFSSEDPRTAEARGTLPFVPGPPTLHPTNSPTMAPDSPQDGNNLENNGKLPLGRNSNPTFLTPLNAQAWDWRRYLGLSLFLGTLVGTFVLMEMSYRRRRKIEKHELWGNYLGNEEGVNALLDATGWKVTGSRLEVYDKGGWGYRDDDSMFMGGYEQTEIVHTGGAGEITVTSPDSLSTPETPTGMNTSIMEQAPNTPRLSIS